MDPTPKTSWCTCDHSDDGEDYNYPPRAGTGFAKKTTPQCKYVNILQNWKNGGGCGGDAGKDYGDYGDNGDLIYAIYSITQLLNLLY